MIVEYKEPTAATLRRYGMTADDWFARLLEQGGRCACCAKVPPVNKSQGRRLMVIDHRHVPKWARLPPEERLKHVRGLVCNHCNHRVLGRFANPELLEAGARYLRERDERWRT